MNGKIVVTVLEGNQNSKECENRMNQVMKTIVKE